MSHNKLGAPDNDHYSFQDIRNEAIDFVFGVTNGGPKWVRRLACWLRGHDWCEPDCCGPTCWQCGVRHPHAYDPEYFDEFKADEEAETIA